VDAVLPLESLGIDQLQVRLVYQRRRGHGAAFPVRPEVRVRNRAEAVVDEGKDAVQRRRTSVPGLQEELRESGLTVGRGSDVRIRHQVALLVWNGHRGPSQATPKTDISTNTGSEP